LNSVETRRLIEATCPECRGPLSEIEDDGIIVYQCLVGHRYSPEGLLRAHYETEERTLWAAVVGLEEVHKLVDAVAPHLSAETAQNVRNDAQEKLREANAVRRILDGLRAFRL
jgi:two-component system chemotaxis response regulator CheB